MTYTLRNNFTVITRAVDTGTEFETRNAQGETISTVRLADDSARIMLADLAARAL